MAPPDDAQDRSGAEMTPRAKRTAERIGSALCLIAEVPAALLVVAEIAVLFAGVAARYVFHAPLIWTDELASLLFLWLAMLGSVIALQRSDPGSRLRDTRVESVAQISDLQKTDSGRVSMTWRGSRLPHSSP
jgi:hypothetical protein